MRITFEVEYVNGDRATFTTRPSTDVAFKHRFGVEVVHMFKGTREQFSREEAIAWYADNIEAEQLGFLAWHASRSDLEFEAWLDSTADIGWRVPRADPTPAAP